MARIKDLWFTTTRPRRKTARHPDNGGNKKAKRWLAVWIDPDGDEKTKAFASQDAAKKYARKMEADAERGQYIDPKAGRELVGGLIAKHLRLRKVRESSRERYASISRNHVEPVFSRRKVKAVKPSEVAEWLLSAAMTRMSVSVQKTAYEILAGAFDVAVADKMRRDNPARSDIVHPPSGDGGTHRQWNADLVWRVHDAHPEPYRPIVASSAALGLRQGMALALAEEDFDFDAEKVHIRRQVTRVGGKWVFKLPKEERQYIVPLPRGLAAIIKAHIEANPPLPYELPWLGEPWKDDDGKPAAAPGTCRLLFRWRGKHPSTRGKHIQASSFNIGVWKPSLARAGVIEPPPEDVTAAKYFERDCGGNGTHVLRHFYSTMLQDAGVPPVGVMEFMGHSRKSLPVTFAVYGHVTEETFEQARQAVDRTLFKLRPVESSGTVTELRTAQ